MNFNFLKNLFGFSTAKNTPSDIFDDNLFDKLSENGCKFELRYEKGYKHFVTKTGRVFESAARNPIMNSTPGPPSPRCSVKYSEVQPTSLTINNAIHIKKKGGSPKVLPLATTAAAISIFQRQQIFQQTQEMNRELGELNDNISDSSGGDDCGIDY